MLATLDEGQKDKATFSFASPERLNWHFIPRAPGFAHQDMTLAQRALYFGLLHTGLCASGYLLSVALRSKVSQLEPGTFEEGLDKVWSLSNSADGEMEFQVQLIEV